MAKLYFRYGAMGSSKTANAVMVQYNYRERGCEVLMLKPKLENRDGATIVRSRCGLETQCRFVEELDSISLDGISCVIVDEAQSLERNVLLTVLSRLGTGSRVVLTHDVAQRDNLRVGRHDGIQAVDEKLKGHPLFAHITLSRSERSAIAELVTTMLEEFHPDGTPGELRRIRAA